MSFKQTLMAAVSTAFLATSATAEIEILDPYARSSNPVAGAAFMMIHNRGDSDDRLMSVTSDVAARVELHTHIEDSAGVMRMTHLEEGVEIPAGDSITLARGAKHVMFMGLTAPFEQDQIVTITLQFEQAGAVTVEVPVDQDRAAEAPEDHSAHDH